MDGQELKAYQQQIKETKDASELICNVLDHIAAGRMNRDLIVSNLIKAGKLLPVYNDRLNKYN
jgi:hypothetical protein